MISDGRGQAPDLINIKFLNSSALYYIQQFLKYCSLFIKYYFLQKTKFKTCILWSDYFRSDLNHKL